MNNINWTQLINWLYNGNVIGNVIELYKIIINFIHVHVKNI